MASKSRKQSRYGKINLFIIPLGPQEVVIVEVLNSAKLSSLLHPRIQIHFEFRREGFHRD